MIDLKIENVDKIIIGFLDLIESEFKNTRDEKTHMRKYKDYFFSQWLRIQAGDGGTMRVVRPAPELVSAVNEVIGYPIAAIMPKRCADGSINWVVSCSTDLDGYTVQAIAGNVQNDYALVNKVQFGKVYP